MPANGDTDCGSHTCSINRGRTVVTKKRTPEDLIKHREAELFKSRIRLARSKDPLILDAEHLRDDLRAFPLTVIDANGCLHLAAEVLQDEIAARVERALAG